MKLDGKAAGRDFTQGSILGQMIPFLSLFLLANLLNSIYNTVDTAVIGQYVGNEGTVAVTVGGKMLNLMTHVGIGLSSAGQILIAQQTGAKRQDELNETIGTLFSMLFISAAGLALLCISFSVPILNFLNTPEEAFSQAWAYLCITSIGLPLMFGYNAVSAALRAMGDSRNPLYFIAIASIVNLVLDIVFIRFMGMGGAGAALATVIGQGLSFVLSVVILYRRKEQFGFDFKLRSFRIKSDKMKKILEIGIPLAANSVFISAAQLYTMKFVNAYGLAQAAAYGIGDKVIHLMNTITTSVKSAAGTMVGQNIGAKKYDRVKQVVHSCLLLSGGSALIMSAAALLFPDMIFSWFTSDADAMAYSSVFMQICALIFILSALMSAYAPVVTGTGNAKLAFIGGVLDGVVLRIGLGMLLGITFHMEVVGFFLGNALCRLGPIAIDSWYYYSGAWKKYKKLVD